MRIACREACEDLALTLVALTFLAGPMPIIAALVRLTSRGPKPSGSKRVGRWNRSLSMPEFRSLQGDTPEAPATRIGNSNLHERFLSSTDVSH